MLPIKNISNWNKVGYDRLLLVFHGFFSIGEKGAETDAALDLQRILRFLVLVGACFAGYEFTALQPPLLSKLQRRRRAKGKLKCPTLFMSRTWQNQTKQEMEDPEVFSPVRKILIYFAY